MPAEGDAAKALATEFGSDRMWGLKELPLPEPLSMFPEAPGWWAVGAIVLALGIAACVRFWRRWQRRGYRREALRRLDRMHKEPTTLSELPKLLRGTALAAFPREEVASLRGPAWVAWLNANGGRFDPADSEWLDRLPYAAGVTDALGSDGAARLLSASRRWVERHHARV